MEKIDEMILDILNLDIETYALIESQLNNENLSIFISQNDGKKFKSKDIQEGILRLLMADYIEPVKFIDNTYCIVIDPKLKITDDNIWYRIKGSEIR